MRYELVNLNEKSDMFKKKIKNNCDWLVYLFVHMERL